MQENKIQAGNTEQVLLSKKNCHRALKVVNIANPEQGEWLFNWRGEKLSDNLMRCDYAHTAVRISDNEVLPKAMRCAILCIKAMTLLSSIRQTPVDYKSVIFI